MTRKRKRSNAAAADANHPRKKSKMEMQESKVFNDPIHGHIELPPLCVRIIDTPQFQRLRHIKQMGGNCFVYPGATHSRFEHSLGVCYLAGEMMKHLQSNQSELDINDEDIKCVQVAGLCHDLGHGPFSHLFDGMFIPAVGKNKTWKHEDASVEMFKYLLNDNKIKLSARCLLFIEELIRGPKDGEGYKGTNDDKRFLYQIIANKTSGIDVDKWDYFARDCYHLGFSSMFDHRRLMKFTRVVRDEKGQRQICFREKEVMNIYDMFHLREVSHRRACFHKTTVSVETMITNAFVEANSFIQIPGTNGNPCTPSECIHDMVAYTRLTDHIYNMILCSTDPGLSEARSILDRLEKRQFYKCVGERKPADKHTFGKKDEGLLKKYLKQNKIAEEDFFIKVSLMLPQIFHDQIVRLYCRSTEKGVKERLQKFFNKWVTANPSKLKKRPRESHDIIRKLQKET